jgi:hypothetical protein
MDPAEVRPAPVRRSRQWALAAVGACAGAAVVAGLFAALGQAPLDPRTVVAPDALKGTEAAWSCTAGPTTACFTTSLDLEDVVPIVSDWVDATATTERAGGVAMCGTVEGRTVAVALDPWVTSAVLEDGGYVLPPGADRVVEGTVVGLFTGPDLGC